MIGQFVVSELEKKVDQDPTIPVRLTSNANVVGFVGAIDAEVRDVMHGFAL